MTCNNCEQNIYDSCVFYTGVDISELCIKKGDTLLEVTKKLIDAIQLMSTGQGILLSDIIINNVTLEALLDGKELNVANILQALISFTEGTQSDLDVLESVVNSPISVNSPCLILPTVPTKDDILKATAEKVCTLNTVITSISTNYVKATEICEIVAACIEEANSNSTNPTIIVQENTKLAKYVPSAYLGPLSVFDGTGKGIASQGYDKVYICNGNNGTQDLRGYTLIGANTNVVGGSLNAAVDPALPANVGYTIAPNVRRGAYTHKLQANENASHSHTITDPGHTHLLAGAGGFSPLTSANSLVVEAGLGGNVSYSLRGISAPPSLGKSSNSKTGVTISNSGIGDAHNNLQPSFGVVYIIYLP